MAERRMFSKSVVTSDAFTDLKPEARCLYFLLGMMADDDGFVGAPKGTVRQCGAGEEDMKALIRAGYLIAFSESVVVLRHWRVHNLLRKDRYKPTVYQEQLAQLTVGADDCYRLRGAAGVEGAGAAETKAAQTAEVETAAGSAETLKPTIAEAVPCRTAHPGAGKAKKAGMKNGGEEPATHGEAMPPQAGEGPDGATDFPPEQTQERPWQPDDNQMATQVRSGKVRSGKVNSEEAGTEGTAPRLEEVEAEIARMGYRLDGRAFCSFYGERDWLVNGRPVQNWKGLLRTWDRRNFLPGGDGSSLQGAAGSGDDHKKGRGYLENGEIDLETLLAAGCEPL